MQIFSFLADRRSARGCGEISIVSLFCFSAFRSVAINNLCPRGSPYLADSGQRVRSARRRSIVAALQSGGSVSCRQCRTSAAGTCAYQSPRLFSPRGAALLHWPAQLHRCAASLKTVLIAAHTGRLCAHTRLAPPAHAAHAANGISIIIATLVITSRDTLSACSGQLGAVRKVPPPQTASSTSP